MSDSIQSTRILRTSCESSLDAWYILSIQSLNTTALESDYYSAVMVSSKACLADRLIWSVVLQHPLRYKVDKIITSGKSCLDQDTIETCWEDMDCVSIRKEEADVLSSLLALLRCIFSMAWSNPYQWPWDLLDVCKWNETSIRHLNGSGLSSDR